MYRKFFKRLIDIIASGLGLLILSPILIIVTVWLHFANKGAGAFFVQARPGYKTKTFHIVKFKTMTDECDAQGNLLPDGDRITKVGSFARRTSLDELPQLWNVLKGDMSLIGPRPLLHKYLPYYTKREQLRHSVLPGITGLAQVNGRNSITWDNKLEYDARYAESISFVNDCKIILQTVRNVIKHEGVEVVTTETEFDEEREELIAKNLINLDR